MQRRISVIIPVYNTEKYLDRCIKSIVEQSYDDWEIILVDDGSTDESAKICDKYAGIFDTISVLHKENGGVSSARNIGLEKALGEYVCFVDGDDWISSHMLEYLLMAIEEDQSDMAMCRIKLMESYESENVQEYSKVKKYTQNSKQYFVDNFLNHGNSCCAKLFRREQLKNLRFQEGLTIGEDMLFLLNARKRFNKVSVLDFPGYYYLQLPTSAMNKAFKPSFMDEVYCWQKALIEVKDDDKEITIKVQSIIIIAAYNVLSKIAKSDVKEKKYSRICKNAIKDNLAGWKFLSTKEKVQCLMAILSTRLYMTIYRLIA